MKRKILVLATLTLLTVGCGKTDPVPQPAPAPLPQNVLPTVPRGSCAAGQVSIWGSCVAAADFPTACRILTGTMTGYYGYYAGWAMYQGGLISVDGVEVCRLKGIPQTSFFGGAGGMGVLDTTNGADYWAFNTGIQLYKGDLLEIPSASGEWGSRSGEIRSWGPFFYGITTGSCDQVDVSGNKDGTPLMNGSFPAGLVGAVGGDRFFIGSRLQSRPVNESGPLKMGFNIPAQTQGGVCGNFRVTNLKVTHCEDAAGNVHSCPAL